MKERKKAIIYTLSYMLCIVALSYAIINPYYKHYMLGASYYQDAPIRQEMSGSIDFLVIGASQASRAFVPEVLDLELGVNSYNLAVPLMTMDSRSYMLEKELKRNPVSSTVIEISYNALIRKRSEEGPEGVLRTLGNLDSYGERIKYFFSYVLPKEYGQIFYQSLHYGFLSWENILNKKIPVYKVDGYSKGFRGLKNKDLTIDSEKFQQNFHRSAWDENYEKDNLEYLEKMISDCKEKGSRVIIVVTPISDKELSYRNNNSSFDEFMTLFANENQCEYYNFNLYKNKDILFPETTAFYDGDHLSDSGARTFSSEVCEVLLANNPQERFWESYEEAEENNSYIKSKLMENN